jgi:hypothetical protein
MVKDVGVQPHPLAPSPLHGEGEQSQFSLTPFPYEVGEGLGMGVLLRTYLLSITHVNLHLCRPKNQNILIASILDL